MRCSELIRASKYFSPPIYCAAYPTRRLPHAPPQLPLQIIRRIYRGNHVVGRVHQKVTTDFAIAFNKEKKQSKALGTGVRNIPGVNHPVFKGHPVNHDPRETFISEFFAERGEKNVFHDFYKTLVQSLYDNGVTANVFCVNIDAVIAAALLKLLWPRYRNGQLSENLMEMAAFTAFLFGRMAGCAGEIDDHINRGRNMDTRTPASACMHVS